MASNSSGSKVTSAQLESAPSGLKKWAQGENPMQHLALGRVIRINNILIIWEVSLVGPSHSPVSVFGEAVKFNGFASFTNFFVTTCASSLTVSLIRLGRLLSEALNLAKCESPIWSWSSLGQGLGSTSCQLAWLLVL